jgi:hypothetical protein
MKGDHKQRSGMSSCESCDIDLYESPKQNGGEMGAKSMLPFWRYKGVIRSTKKLLVSRGFVPRHRALKEGFLSHRAQGRGLSTEQRKALFCGTKLWFDIPKICPHLGGLYLSTEL